MSDPIVFCPYCKNHATLVDGLAIYPHRPDLAELRFWKCAPCEAYVGCHKGTTNPLGRLANAELRKAKMATHAVFDPIWKDGHMRRGEAYRWLQSVMTMTEEECHIGEFSDVCGGDPDVYYLEGCTIYVTSHS